MKIKLPVIVITLVGLIDAIYLIVIKYANNESLCFISAGDCSSVNNSIYSEIYGIPIAGIGAAAFLAILVMPVFESRSTLLPRWFPDIFFGISLIGVIYSAYLTYFQIAVINAVCPFCVFSAVCMLVLFILSILQLAGPRLKINVT